MNEPTEQRYALWDQFLTLFPIGRIQTMRLEEYTLAGSKETFTWWVESGLDSLGSIWGSFAFKFGIYARKSADTPFQKKQYRGNEQYGWLAKYGETPEEAFAAVKSVILTIVKAAQQGDLDSIEKADLSSMYKWKLAHLYQDRNKPIVVNTFKKEVLGHFLQAQTGTPPPKNATLSFLHREIMKLRNGQDLLEFGNIVWREGVIRQAYTGIKADFLRYFPGFTSFANPTEAYMREERNYKEELCTIYIKEIAPRLHPLPANDEELIQLGKDISNLFWRKLASGNAQQNLVGWRYSEFAKKMDEKGMIAFAKAVSRLTDSSIDVAVRIPVFIDFLHEYSVDRKCGQAATRSITTFFLFLSDPAIHFFIKTEEVSKLLKLFNFDGFNNDSLAPEEYSRVQRLAGEIFQLLTEDGLAPRDMIDVQSFVWSGLSAPNTEDQPKKNTDQADPPPQPQEEVMTLQPLNLILYGPPGTGKTFNTATRAVQICDGTCPVDRAALMQRYRQLIAEKRISFVSFHQSFSYEEFIEGIRPELAGLDGSEQEQLIYKIEDGLFKKICSMARTAVDDLQRPTGMVEDLANKSFFKMSVGGKYDPEVESFCFQNGYLALGYGGDVNFSVLPKEKKWELASSAIKKLMVEQGSEHAEKRFATQAIYSFKDWLDVGDIVIVPKGISEVQAIGQVIGEYEYRPELLPGLGYEHFRKVKWLIRDANIPVEKILTKNFSMQSIYNLNPAFLNMDYLTKLLTRESEEQDGADPERYVLIIDEINRANISKVLGELITLIEPDKRLGRLNEVTVKLPYSREEFGVPANLHIVGTMNTADRSLALMDTALRRRFEFEEMMPDYELLAGIEIGGIEIDKLLKTMNQRIEALYDREHTIGHAFFIPLKREPTVDNLASIFANKIIPLLAEYFFEDWQKIRLVLGDNQKTDRPEIQFIQEAELENTSSILFGNSTDLAMYGLDRVRQYTRNKDALTAPDAYVGIYNSAALKEE